MKTVEPLQEQPQLKGSIRSNCKSLPLPNFKDSLAAEIKSTMRKSVDTSGSSECKTGESHLFPHSHDSTISCCSWQNLQLLRKCKQQGEDERCLTCQAS
ncbi:Hypothetical predicted protein [Podarcis lilfordi]|uniref:Uncharacterized protein n=1 Tax=Podarcis lilfordi TaxID=74358 RepID=A0AA35PIJ3_9SAUR|nr:Hypothetical predicted protein [Podarcis lilfordi]